MRATPFIEVNAIRTEESLTTTGGDAMKNIKDKLTPEMIENALGERSVLVYDLKVKAVSEKLAKTRARAFVRVKNPFEPSTVDIIQVQEVRGGYVVAVGVRK